jgi:hypothetical protein
MAAGGEEAGAIVARTGTLEAAVVSRFDCFDLN